LSRKIIVVDYQKCSGCRTCEVVCSYEKYRVCNPALSRIRVMTWMREGLRIPAVCHQCEEPYCKAICPSKAIYVDEGTGLVLIDENRCVGCRACIVVCPFGEMLWNGERKVAMKCDLCGGEPKCVRLCEPKAIQYVDKSRANLTKMRDSAIRLTTLLQREIGKVSGDNVPY
jgi:Fe-S-cluster-containing hydrogenase component 2